MGNTAKSRKRTVIVVASAAVFVVALAATAVAQVQRFSDVPPDHEAFEAVEWAAEVEVTTGYGDGTFKPEQPLSRRHARVFLERFYDDVLGADGDDSFTHDDFTRGDMMKLLKAINDGGSNGSEPEPTATTEPPPTGTTGDWERFSGTFAGIDPQPYVGIFLEAADVWDHSSSFGDNFAILHIRCSQGQTDVFIAWDGLVFGHYNDDRVAMDWRWDQNPIVSAVAYEGANASTTFIVSPTAADFGGKTELRVQTYHYSDFTPEKGALFNVSGYAEAKQWLSGCGDDI